MLTSEKTISEVLAEFLGDLDISKASLALYRRVLILFIKYLSINNLSYNSLTRQDVIIWKSQIADSHLPKTTNLYLSVVKSFYKWLKISGIYEDYTLGIKLLDVPHTYRKLPLTTSQVQDLLNSIDIQSPIGKRDHALINLMILTGLRRIEIHRLDVADILELNGKPALNIWRKGHTSKDNFKVISNELVNELKELICICPENQIESLFVAMVPGKKQTKLSTRRISEIVSKRLRAIGLTGKMYTAHSLRHTTAVLLLENGYDLHYVQMALGHSSPGTTQLYAKYIQDKLNLNTDGIISLQNLFKK